jgi:branched-chain amino acid transport system permease protein
MSAFAAHLVRLPRWAGLAGVAAFALAPLVANQYQLFVGNLMLIYIVLAAALNILIGYAGQLAFANGALFGIGAYGTGLLMLDGGWPFWLALPAGSLITMLAGVLVALPALRLRSLYLALATVAFAQFTLWTFIHWDGLTHGSAGFVLPRVSFQPLTASTPYGIYYLSLVLTVVLLLLAWNLLRSRVGRAFVAVRENEVAAAALAIDVTRTKTIAYAVSALYAGVAGGLFAVLLGVVVPEQFNLFQIVIMFCMVIVGGLGSFWGVVAAAIALVWLQEALRGLQELQEIGFGALLLLTLLFFPGGLAEAARRLVPDWREPLRRSPSDDGAAG